MAASRFLDPSKVPLKRQSGGNIWASLVPFIVGGIVIALMVGVALLFVPVLNTEQTYKDQEAKLQREIGAAQDEQAQFVVETQQMKDDPAYVEHIARDQLNMGKPGETVIRFDKYQALPPTPASVAAPRNAADSGN
jgi:cell division protein FtsB